jgi:hypothetical protein
LPQSLIEKRARAFYLRTTFKVQVVSAVLPAASAAVTLAV